MEVDRRSVLHSTADQYAEVDLLVLPCLALQTLSFHFTQGCLSARSAVHFRGASPIVGSDSVDGGGASWTAAFQHHGRAGGGKVIRHICFIKYKGLHGLGRKSSIDDDHDDSQRRHGA